MLERKRSYKVLKFIEEVVEVCKKHGLTIGHEDGHGAFKIADDYDPDWFAGALDYTPEGQRLSEVYSAEIQKRYLAGEYAHCKCPDRTIFIHGICTKCDMPIRVGGKKS